MTTYFTDSFTGSNGSPWNASNWTTSGVSALNTAGSAVEIQSNRGRLNSGSVGSFGGHAASRYSGSNLTDAEMSGTVIFNDTINGSFECWIRASTSQIDGTGYAFACSVGTTDNVVLVLADNYDYTPLAFVSVTITQGVEYGWKHYCVGNTHKCKVWATSGSEPAYQIDETDSTVTGSGYIYVHAKGGSTSGFDVDIDDVTLTDGSGGTSATYTGSVTGTGAFSRTTVTKNPFTGSVTPVGAWSYIKVVPRVFTSSVTTIGTFAKNVTKSFSGSSTAVGVSLRVPEKSFAGTVTISGAFEKVPIRVFTGTITAVGVSVITFIGRVFGRPGRVKTVVSKAGEIRMRIRRG